MFRTLTSLVTLMLLACGSSTPEPAAPEPAAKEAPAAAASEGKTYDPPIDEADVLDGAWMCDMGTVHYVASHAGECPICGMKLVHKE